MKFTDAEIEKALKCCANKKQCSDCPFCVTSREPCYITLAREAASLLARREAEIARLEEILGGTSKVLTATCAGVRAEAIKEFAERMKKRSHICHMIAINEKAYQILEGDLDNLVKEMTQQ